MTRKRHREASYREPYDWHETLQDDVDLEHAMDPLRKRLAAIDDLRGQMEKQWATPQERVGQLETLAGLLEEPFHLRDPDRPGHEIALKLTDKRSVEEALWRISPRVHLNARVDPQTGLPNFLLFRIATSWFSEYSSLVEEYARSEHYPIDDPRFAKAMVHGRERWYLRLSPLRTAAKRYSKQNNTSGPRITVDSLLNDLARYVLQASWHDTQRVAALLAKGLQMPNLRHTIELVYFANTAELGQIRKLNEIHISFVRDHINPVLAQFIAGTQGASAEDFIALRERARQSYRKLQRAFGRFMGLDVPWGQSRTKMRLTFIVHGNFSRLRLVIPMLAEMEPVTKAAAQLDSESAAIAQDLLGLGRVSAAERKATSDSHAP